jgi:cold shock CspA family protein
MKASKQMQGTIAFFDPTKGYGFVSTPTEDIFFHRSAMPEQVRNRRFENGTPCEFEVGTHNGRRVATKVAPALTLDTAVR